MFPSPSARASKADVLNRNVVRKFFEKSLMAIEKVIDAQFAALEVIGRKPNVGYNYDIISYVLY